VTTVIRGLKRSEIEQHGELVFIMKSRRKTPWDTDT
jgi:hypothetical protein